MKSCGSSHRPIISLPRPREQEVPGYFTEKVVLGEYIAHFCLTKEQIKSSIWMDITCGTESKLLLCLLIFFVGLPCVCWGQGNNGKEKYL